eukprot:CAMPEP_0119277974 /NCGR_PEP_ID=MMETSP1329-20130426/18233_1 /TAXON_ID=114041 /ORGANISM="Genus nov. species nov., Strain RCC1024" /LENGTH=90 /DNA_ID=CAMNT_0007278471 /DNA_START=76 /DNA_END=344 /DNA_ORIENTATION=-
MVRRGWLTPTTRARRKAAAQDTPSPERRGSEPPRATIEAAHAVEEAHFVDLDAKYRALDEAKDVARAYLFTRAVKAKVVEDFRLEEAAAL